MWRRVDLVWTDVLEERIASIFRVQKFASEEPAWAGGSVRNRRENLKSYLILKFSILGIVNGWRATYEQVHISSQLKDI
jgi:hypothetical protein